MAVLVWSVNSFLTLKLLERGSAANPPAAFGVTATARRAGAVP